jgi:Domain of unknown function (DUF4386)
VIPGVIYVRDWRQSLSRADANALLKERKWRSAPSPSHKTKLQSSWGITYLFSDATAIFAEFYVRSNLIAHDNAAKTAANIMASERLFRLGVASQLITVATVVVLIAALYVILKPASPGLALLATLWRLIENSVVAVMTLRSFDVLRLLSGAAHLRAFEADRLQALTMLSIAAHGDA